MQHCVGTTPYHKLIQEARALFDEWDAKEKIITVTVGDSVFVKRTPARKLYCDCGRRAIRRGLCEFCRVEVRGQSRQPCQCGKPYYAADKCRACYFREYNKTRIRTVKKKIGTCHTCGKRKPILALDLCVLCYGR